MAEILTYLSNTFFITKTKAFLTFILSFFFSVFAGYEVIIKSLIILMIIDFLLGFSLAVKENLLSKERLKLGGIKIVAYCVALIVFCNTDLAINGIEIFGFGIMEIGVAYLAVNETLSALKHLGKLGVPIPKKIIKKLENYRDDLDCEEEKICKKTT